MNHELVAVIEQIGRERGIGTDIIIGALESALLTAAKKRFGGGGENIRIHIDPKTGEIEVVYLKKIVEKVQNPQFEISLEEAKKVDTDAEIGDEIGDLIDIGDFGRIAAQTVKQIIFQKVREAEWDVVLREYRDRQGELINGVILRQDKANYIVDLGRTEAILSQREQIPNEHFRRGDRIRALLLEVKSTPKGPQLILSRTHPNFVAKLFEMEVPEVYEEMVEIKGVAREPGDRTKIAVYSKDQKVDPVGACVGMKGSRVQSVVRELRGEKIDIISWTEDPRSFIAKALSPAVVERVGIREEEKSAAVIVPDQQLSLAIGKKGQNVRLAAKLTGWKIDILSESEYDKKKFAEKEKELEKALTKEAEAKRERILELTEIPSVGEKIAEILHDHGFTSIERIATATEEELMAVPKIGAKTAAKLIASAKELLEQKEVQTTKEELAVSESADSPAEEAKQTSE